MSGAGGVTVPLSRNRNFRLLWGSQVLSEFGLHASTLAFPLLALAVTGSPGTSGLVLSAIAGAQFLVGLPAGALADRWSRKKIMVGCEVAQVVAAVSLVAALLWGVVAVAHMVVVALVMGVCGALFEPAEDSSLPTVVAADQVPAAVALNSARSFLAQLAGTAAGGFLFGVARIMPFAADALMHALALLGLAPLRLPEREVHRAPVRHLVREIGEGLQWVWRNRPVRVITLCAVGLNVFFAAYYIVIIVLAKARGVPSGQIGVMAAMLGVGGFLGTLVAPYLHRRLRPYLSITGVFWALTLLAPLAVLARDGYVMGALFAAMSFLAPTANTTIHTYQLLLTPDALRGRLSGAMSVAGGLAASVGPALGGLLMEIFSRTQAVLLCSAGIGVVTLLSAMSPTLRGFPRHHVDEELGTADQAMEPQA